MKCSMCDNVTKLTKEILPKYKYKSCGLDNVILHGATIYRCYNCGEEYLELGNSEQLHNLISSTLIKKNSTMSGKEIRFLRKNLGYSAAVFAKIVGYENEHLSRIENGKTPVQEVFDLLVRMLVLERFPDSNYHMQDLFLEGKLIPIDWLEFSMVKKKWVIAA